MFLLISEKFLLCIAMIFLILSFLMCIKVRSFDKNSIERYGSRLMELSYIQRHRLLLKGKVIKISYLVSCVLFSIVIYTGFAQNLNFLLSLLLSVVIAILITVAMFELVLMISALLRNIIAVNSAVLNVLFSSVIINISILCIDYFTSYEMTFAMFLFAQICLVFCYVMMLLCLVMVLKEASDEDSRLTIRNIWKSAVLVIALFWIILSLMSGYCFIYDSQAFKGVENGFLDMVYFTAVTFSTVGYGDVVPCNSATKLISILCIITSILCISILLSGIAGVKKNKK